MWSEFKPSFTPWVQKCQHHHIHTWIQSNYFEEILIDGDVLLVDERFMATSFLCMFIKIYGDLFVGMVVLRPILIGATSVFEGIA